MNRFDAVVIGAGAAGLMCAAIAGQRGLRVALIDHSTVLAEKIRISGGGRCNFTNRDVGPANFLSANPHFCRSALARYTPTDFLSLLARHGIDWHEKHKGQLFCDDRSEAIINMLVAECDAGEVTRWQGCRVHDVRHDSAGFALDTDNGPLTSASLVVATGGLSIPKLGATDFGHRLARRFGHDIIEPRPALVPLTFDQVEWQPFAQLAGLSVPATVSAGSGAQRGTFDEDLLFTHRGLSGPAALQISSYWRPGEPLSVALADGKALLETLQQAKAGSRRRLSTELAATLPTRLADLWVDRCGLGRETLLAEVADKALRRLAESLSNWSVRPNGTEGYRKAEVTVGGVDTRGLNSQSMESLRQAGLYFIGEVVDVTGWLGGYNFQWAWASAAACARALPVAVSAQHT